MATSVSGAAPNKRGRVGECILLKVVMDTSLRRMHIAQGGDGHQLGYDSKTK